MFVSCTLVMFPITILITIIISFNCVYSEEHHSTFSDIKVISINAWLFPWQFVALERDARLAAMIQFLLERDYDIVFMQELWSLKDFKKIQSIFPYSTIFGTPGNVFCGNIFFKQILNPLGCNGLAIFSRHSILSTNYLLFSDNINVIDERLVSRGVLSATILVKRSVDDVLKTEARVAAVDSHLASWYGDELRHSSTREKQAEEVIKAADMFFYSEAVDVIIVAGDLNSSPHSPVYNIFTSGGFTDTLVSRHGDNYDQYQYHTWGNTANTWSRPGGPQSDGYSTRLDYVFYKLMPHYGQVRSVDVVEQETVDPKIYKQSGNIFFSLSDHSLVETTIRLKF